MPASHAMSNTQKASFKDCPTSIPYFLVLAGEVGIRAPLFLQSIFVGEPSPQNKDPTFRTAALQTFRGGAVYASSMSIRPSESHNSVILFHACTLTKSPAPAKKGTRLRIVG